MPKSAPIVLFCLLLGADFGSSQTNPTTHSVAQGEEGRYRSALLFANVVELVRDEYLDPHKTDYDKITYAALRGLLSSLDPHSQFLDPEGYAMIRTETEGQFGGLAISVGMLENH